MAFHPLPQRLNGSESSQAPCPPWSSRLTTAACLNACHPDWRGGVWWGGMGWGGCHVSFKQTQKGTRCFRANTAKPANLARVWGWGRHRRADVPFVGLNELAGWSEEGRRAGEKKAARPDLLWPPSRCQPVPGRQTQFICFIGPQSLYEGKVVLQQIPLANCWSNEQFGSKLAPVSHCSLELTSDLHASSLFSALRGSASV